MRRKLLSIFWLAALVSFVATLPTPQLRSVQLGGTGPRPVLLGGQPQGPTYSQQLTFGGQQPQQFQPQQLLSQNPALRFGQSPIPSPQTPSTRPIVLQQGRPTAIASPSPFGQSPIGSFPIAPSVRGQQLVYRQPSPQIAVSPTSATDDDEYEDDEYSDEQIPSQIRQTQTTARPQIVQRIPARQFLQAQAAPTLQAPQPQRFAVPQQIQSAQAPRTRQRIQPQPQPQQVQVHPTPAVYAQQPGARLGQDNRILSDRQTTVAPIQTLNRFMRQNEDGSITWGYENEDGTFKEETLGADCVVRGKYGYVDPDGVKREYEYQSGNPCDPNKRGQEEEEDEVEEGLVGQQRLAGLLNARPIQLQQRVRQ